MTIYTLGFTQKNAAEFFNLIRSNAIEVLIDIRLNNKSQLAGFTKGTDLSFFLKEICNCKYQHCIEFAPTKDILDNYKKGSISWSEYEKSFIPLITKRNVTDSFMKKFGNYRKVCLLCSEPTPENCHRRLLAEYLVQTLDADIIHL